MPIKVETIAQMLPAICRLHPDVVFLQVGSNNISHETQNGVQISNKIETLVNDILTRSPEHPASYYTSASYCSGTKGNIFHPPQSQTSAMPKCMRRMALSRPIVWIRSVESGGRVKG